MSDTTDMMENAHDDGHAFLFSSESVNGKHHGQICDRVSDEHLDACLTKVPEYKIAGETSTNRCTSHSEERWLRIVHRRPVFK